MPDKAFFDTNVIIYAYSKTEPQKSHIANELIFGTEVRLISSQVINELANTFFSTLLVIFVFFMARLLITNSILTTYTYC